MLIWRGTSGFSLDGSVRIAAHGRAGLERPLRYCARPPFELLDRLARLIPPPRVHRHSYHGVFAPNAKWRRDGTHYGRDEVWTNSTAARAVAGPSSSPVSTRSTPCGDRVATVRCASSRSSPTRPSCGPSSDTSVSRSIHRPSRPHEPRRRPSCSPSIRLRHGTPRAMRPPGPIPSIRASRATTGPGAPKTPRHPGSAAACAPAAHPPHHIDARAHPLTALPSRPGGGTKEHGQTRPAPPDLVSHVPPLGDRPRLDFLSVSSPEPRLDFL